MRRITIGAVLLFPALALAQAVIPDPGTDVPAFLTAVLTALRGGDWKVVAALAMVGVIFILRKFGAKVIPWLATSLGGATFTGLVVLVTGLAATLFAHQSITWALLGTLLVATWTAAGTWTWLRRMLALVAKIPGVAGKLGAWVLAILGGDPDTIVQAAADAAKTATPATATGAKVASGLDPK